MNFAQRVANGATALDMDVPGWFNMINVEKLDIGSINHCIMGQLETALGLDSWDEVLPGAGNADFAIEHGFLRDFRMDPRREWNIAERIETIRQEYNKLTEEWRKAIAERKANEENRARS